MYSGAAFPGGGIGTLLQQLIEDVHPPLYYFLLKIILDISHESLVCARLFSAVSCIIFLWCGTLFIQQNFGEKSAVFYVFFLYLNPFMPQKATEIRMYMFASMFVIWSGIVTLRLLQNENKREWICLVISSLLAAYSHYYAILTVAFLYGGILIWFLIKRNKRGIYRWFLCSVATVVAYLPWLPIVVRQIKDVNGGYWIEAPPSRLAPLRELFYSRIGYEIRYSEHVYILCLLAFVMLALIAFIKTRSVEAYWALVCNSALWGILVFSLIYMKYFRPILVSRYLIMAVCLAALGGCSTIRFINRYIVLLFCAFFLVVGGKRYRDSLADQRNRNTTDTLAYVEENMSSLDTIFYIYQENAYFSHCMTYYFPEISSQSIKQDELDYLREYDLENQGSTYFFDLDDAILSVSDVELEDCGRFGFNSMTFEIYKVIKK